MQTMLIVFFVWLLFCIIFFPFKSRIMAHFDFVEVRSFYCVKVWRLKLLCGEVFYRNLKVNVNNTKNIFKKSYKKKNFKHFTKNIFKEIKLTKMEMYFVGGSQTNAMTSAMLCGAVKSVIESFYSFLNARYCGVILYEDVDPLFTQNGFEITVDSVFQISIFQIFIAWIRSFKMKLGVIDGKQN